MSQAKLESVCQEIEESDTIVTDDGREFEIPDTIPFKISIGRKTRMEKGYVTDEMMTVDTPSGWLIGEEIPKPLRGLIQNPQIEYSSGDNRVWECPAGQHSRPKQFKKLLESRDGIEIDYFRENEGRHDETRIAVEVTTKKIELQ